MKAIFRLILFVGISVGTLRDAAPAIASSCGVWLVSMCSSRSNRSRCSSRSWNRFRNATAGSRTNELPLSVRVVRLYSFDSCTVGMVVRLLSARSMSWSAVSPWKAP
uniref:Putative secreted protein n=1 Tax=Anopheles darlingi TaxID=43151 RepID=A0A2M4D8B2_ANODA